jgi:hypothetical protein
MICHWNMGLRWRVNGRWTLWRLVNITFRGLTELQEQSRNAAHTSAITHGVETNGWGQRSIVVRDGWHDMDPVRRRIVAGNGSQLDMDEWPEVDDRRYMTGDGSREMDHGRRMTINLLPLHEDIEVMRSFTFLEIMTLISIYATTQLQWNADMQTYDVLAAWLHRVRYRALFRDAELCSYMSEFQCRIRSQIRSRVTATMPILHKPYEINLWQSNNL